MSLQEEAVVNRVREKLNKEQVKLWLSPYHSPTGENNEKKLQELANKYATELGLSQDVALETIKHLQSHALEKVAAKYKFQNTGIATLKVRIAWGEREKGRVMNIEIKLTATGKELKESISTETDVTPERLKLICTGCLLKDDVCLKDQGVKYGGQIMAVLLSDTDAVDKVKEEYHSMLQSVRADAKLLASRSVKHDDSYCLQVADQFGKPLNLPHEEKKSLVVAMALHEKGRAALKREDYSYALVLLLEAEQEFSQCRSQLLSSVDNYALLNLDISWCYLCLQSVTEIPNAEARLKQCEENFHHSYGPNLERLMAVKGTTGNEASLFMRLHLLQAIVAYHQNQPTKALTLLQQAEKELQLLQVDDNTLSQVMALGYTSAEARLGLRVAQGNITMAVEHILKNREEKDEIRKKEEEKRRADKLQRKFGKFTNGEWINTELYDTMKSMGYPSVAAKMALKQCNNNLPLAVQLLQEKPHLLNIPDTERKSVVKKTKITDELVAEVVSMGFAPDQAHCALRKHKGRITEAVEELVTNGGVISSVSSFLDSQDDSSSEEENNREAYERLTKDISTFEEDHLDLTLEAEAAFLQKYKGLLRQ